MREGKERGEKVLEFIERWNCWPIGHSNISIFSEKVEKVFHVQERNGMAVVLC